MSEFKVAIDSGDIDPKERARRLAKAYMFILSWEVQKPSPSEQSLTSRNRTTVQLTTELAAENLGGDAAASSISETPNHLSHS